MYTAGHKVTVKYFYCGPCLIAILEGHFLMRYRSHVAQDNETTASFFVFGGMSLTWLTNGRSSF